jgi:hypothetical protein
LWMIMEHPVFLDNMVRLTKLQMSRKDLKAALASPPETYGCCNTVRCSFDQLKRAKSMWRADAVRSFEDCMRRLPHWMKMYNQLNTDGSAVLERTEAGQFYRAVLLPPGLQNALSTLFVKVSEATSVLSLCIVLYLYPCTNHTVTCRYSGLMELHCTMDGRT